MDKFKLGFFFILFGLLYNGGDLVAQNIAPVPWGAPTNISTVHFGNFESSFVWSTDLLKFNSQGTWYPPEGAGQIYSAIEKKNSSGTLLVLTTAGRIFEVVLDINFGYVRVQSSIEITPPPSLAVPYNHCVGDALYALATNGQIYQTQNDTTWQVDTAGFGTTRPQFLALDTERNVFATTGEGIFEQGPSGITWNLLPGSPTNGVFYLFVSQADVIYAPTQYLMMSADHGATWIPDSAGMGVQLVNFMSDDSAGNLYATSSYGMESHSVWMKPVGGVWHSIGAALNNLNYDSLDQVSQNYLTGVVADSGIHVSTSFGLFSSYDTGTTWQPDNAGISAENIYDFFKFSDGRQIATTDLGLFSENAGDTTWNKTFPQNSYYPGIQFFVDNSKHLYLIGASRRETYLNGFAVEYHYYPNDIFVSTDEGSTWQPDTTGLSQFTTSQQGYQEFVDESGTEHIASYDMPHMRLYSKSPGGSWQGDSTGYVPASGDAPGTFASDHNGSIYLAVNDGSGDYELLKRPITGGMWSVVSTSALAGTPYLFTATQDGKLVGGSPTIATGLYDGNGWTILPAPSGLVNPGGWPASVDSMGRLWVMFFNLPQFDGTYWTSDLGMHWTEASGDTLPFNMMVSFGDTTYATPLGGNGLYYFAPGTADVSDESTDNMNTFIVPNPSTGNITISVSGVRDLNGEIYDVLGNLEATVKSSSGTAIWSGENLDGSRVSAGAYIIRISGIDSDGNEFSDSKEIIIQ